MTFSATPEMRGGPGYDDMPEALRGLIVRGDRLFERVVQFDRLERGLSAAPARGAQNGIADQLARLKAAYEKLSR